MAISMAAEELVVHGAREHNLKDITVRLPRNALICITGLSGSGKSSLAFAMIYARVGRPHCPVCGRLITGQSIDSIVEQILTLSEGTRFTVNAPIVRDRKGEYRDRFEELRNEGFTRVKVDGKQHTLDEPPALDKKFKHTIEVVVDRLVMKEDLRTRLTQSVETAVALAEGIVVIDLVDSGEERTFSQNFACPEHGVS